MSIEINWQPVLGGLLIVGGAVWAAFQAWRSRPAKPVQTKIVVEPDGTISPVPPQRSADEPSPPGAVEWVQDIVKAMGSADPAFKLVQLESGSSRDTAKAARINELEAMIV